MWSIGGGGNKGISNGNSTEISKSFAMTVKFTCRNCGGGDRGRVAIYRPFGEVSLSLNRTVTCMVLKANDRRTSCPCHDEFRGPRSDYVRQLVEEGYKGVHWLSGSVSCFYVTSPWARLTHPAFTPQWVDK
ncbi:uncharacterized protein TNCV_4304181 [Trichonephila clavipes]|uniref:Uncharacterized protein n=1 Tax=Trichonephila clavipes TaxID=2585209 RepID=A0A8X6R7T3_TRICX|nr:uncharacterized protein TNCV_4304181 [Trichonephila clavipes]